MGKYDPWDRFFAELAGEEVALNLDELERRTGVRLPPVARRRPEWWSGDRYWAKWKAHGWHVHTRLATGSVIFSRQPPRRGRPTTQTTTRSEGHARSRPADLVVVGCVAQKVGHASRARDLYTSPLWRGRRSHAESSGRPWFILSAEYGLLHPDEVVEPYDRYLESEPRSFREAWSVRVCQQVLAQARELGATSVELHAGSAYLDYGFVDCLESAGIAVERPLQGLRIGEQLSWYRTGGSSAEPVVDGTPAREQMPIGLHVPTAEHVHGVAATYRSGALGESWDDLPEVWNLPKAEPRRQRLWVTFVAAVDRARDAGRLWRAAHDAWDQESWIFEPRQVVERSVTELSEVLRGYGLSQRHSVDVNGWRMIAESLVSRECPLPITRALGGGPARAPDLLVALDTPWPSGTPMFPLVSGPKIGPMWVRMLAFPGGAAITDMEVIPVAVDTHVQRVTEMLGLVSVRKLDDRHRRAVQRVWFEAVQQSGSFGAPGGTDGTPAGIDPALWALGKEGCSRCERERRKVKVGPICELCVLARG